MPEFDLDVAPAQIILWLMDELRVGHERVVWRATVTYEESREPSLEKVDPDDDAGIRAVSAIGILNIEPAGDDDGWSLTGYVRDYLGPHIPEDSSESDDPEEIEINDFFSRFIEPGSAIGHVSLKAESLAAKAHFDRLAADITTDRHPT